METNEESEYMAGVNSSGYNSYNKVASEVSDIFYKSFDFDQGSELMLNP
jgi:hypothetical protein